MDFKTEVIDKSYEKPVVVDFWAPWCGPCRMLGPTMEALASEQADQWELVKLNTEDNYEVAEEYNIRSIPNVKMFYKGEVVAEFMGAQPRTVVERWLKDHLPDGRKEQLALILSRIDGEGALSELEAFVNQNPAMEEARIALARQIVYSNPVRATALVETIRIGHQLEEEAEGLRAIAELMALEPGDSAACKLLAQAQEALRKKDNEAAIKHVIAATEADKNYEKELPRRVAIALFNSWGAGNPLTKQYRRRFDMALY